MVSWYIEVMKTPSLPKLDRTVFSFTSLTDPSDEKEFWLSKTPYERLEALEIMRQIVYGYDPLTTRIQKIFEVAQRNEELNT